MARRQAIQQMVAGAALLGLPGATPAGASPVAQGGGWAAEDVVINAEGPAFHSKLSLATSREGTTWAAWHAYHRSRDRIMARRIGPGSSGPFWTVTQGGSIHAAPVIVALEGGSAWVFWSARQAKRWRLLGRRFHQDTWQPTVAISPPESDALLPAAACLDDGRVLATWSERRDGRSRIVGRVWQDGEWRDPLPVSPDAYDAFRSALAVEEDGAAWAVWDGYQEGQYAVWARRCLPKPGPVEQVSPQGENCLLPAAQGTRCGVCVAWLQAADWGGGEGVISQRYTLHMAVRRGGAWEIVRSSQGDPTAALLAHGLVEKIEPQPVATGGYLGRRRQAMLVEEEGAVWLLWERKTDHEARTPDATGDLLGRPCIGGRWQEAVILRQGYLDYRVVDAARAVGGKFLLVASDLPRDYRRTYHRLVGSLRGGRPFSQGPWTGWRPARLPKSEPIPRHEIRAGDKTYRLFWGDLHCHSHLSLDAEGEPDELLYYARDKARLDVVVFTENDHMYNAWLTEAEFALGVCHANRFSEEGKFVALPGYEWTSRIPKTPDVDLDDPRNWDPRYYGTTKGDWARTASGLSYQNHRSVIYPMAGGPVLRHPEVGNDIRRLLAAVAEAGGLAHPHHAVWKLSDNNLEANLEVTSGWGVYIRDPKRIHEALNSGHRFGFLGNSDNHRRTPGLGGALSGIYAEALTPCAVLDALRNHRVFATTGSRIVVDSRANGALMGQEAPAPAGRAEIRLRLIGTRPIVEAVLIRDGEEIRTFPGDGSRKLFAVFPDRGLAPGVHWYYWRITQQGESPDYGGNVKVAEGPLAWSSPHWVIVP